jgi:hypothetical protein
VQVLDQMENGAGVTLQEAADGGKFPVDVNFGPADGKFVPFGGRKPRTESHSSPLAMPRRAASLASTTIISIASIAKRTPVAKATRSLIDITSWTKESAGRGGTTIVPAPCREDTRLSIRTSLECKYSCFDPLREWHKLLKYIDYHFSVAPMMDWRESLVSQLVARRRVHDMCTGRSKKILRHASSQINNDVAHWLRAADQHITVRRCIDRIRPVADRPCHKCGLAGVADPRSTRPSHRHVASLSQFEQALERWRPADTEAATGERNQRA